MGVFFRLALSVLCLNIGVFGDGSNDWKNDPKEYHDFPPDNESPVPNYKENKRKLDISNSGSFNVLEKSQSIAANPLHAMKKRHARVNSRTTFVDTMWQVRNKYPFSIRDIFQGREKEITNSCERNRDGSHGTFRSPGYIDMVRSDQNCQWHITTTPGEKIFLNITDTQMYLEEDCEHNYLEIRDGFGHKSNILGIVCGANEEPTTYLTSGHQMLVNFRTSRYHTGLKLFSAVYEDACGGIIENINGTISSPYFPQLYPANKNCIWEIIAQPQYKITLNFKHFDLEGFNQDCEYDSVDIRSKMGENEVRKHGVFCGSRLPPAITSEGSNLRIEFNSDSTVQRSGFAAVFFTDKDECATNNGGCQQICKNNIGSYTCACNNGFVIHENKHDCKEGSCTHKITTSQGEIVSPNHPESYPRGEDCSWTFTTTPGHRIKLVFQEFELEPHQECAYDYIAIYDGDSTDSPLLGRFCGSKTPRPMLASSNRMFMVFKSDASVQSKGFRAAHSTVCGGRLVAMQTVEHLYSHSKYGDQDYDNKEDCDWVIEPAAGHRVLLRFLTFEVEHEPDCIYDYVEIYDGYDDSSTLVGKYCGYKVPPEFISTGDNLLLRFRSDDMINRKGFSAAYQEVDSGEDDERHEKFHFSY